MSGGKRIKPKGGRGERAKWSVRHLLAEFRQLWGRSSKHRRRPPPAHRYPAPEPLRVAMTNAGGTRLLSLELRRKEYETATPMSLTFGPPVSHSSIKVAWSSRCSHICLSQLSISTITSFIQSGTRNTFSSNTSYNALYHGPNHFRLRRNRHSRRCSRLPSSQPRPSRPLPRAQRRVS